eukprot:gene16642-22892_t
MDRLQQESGASSATLNAVNHALLITGSAAAVHADEVAALNLAAVDHALLITRSSAAAHAT